MAVNSSGNKSQAILAWAQQHGQEFTNNDAAVVLGVEPRAVASALRGLVSKGALQIKEFRDRKRIYIVSPVETPPATDLADLTDPEFIPNLRQALADRLAELHTERNKIDTEADRIRSAFGALSAE